jgi:hypothetical protein
VTEDQQRLYKDVAESLRLSRDRLRAVSANHHKDNVVSALICETAHERELLLQLERIIGGPGVTTWDRLRKPEVG